ncbi:MAG: DUF2284 domain-containing protein [Candidatus Hodarchaeota archaeon]
MEKAELEKFVDVAKELGAADARIIKAGNVVTGDWVRLKCQYGCGGYGKRLTCPPYSPTPETTSKVIANYEWALLSKLVPEPPDHDHAITHEQVASLERAIFLDGYHAALGLACGPCPICKKCNLKQCANPRLARPSMEACGIDVYKTARNAGFEIRVVKKRSEQPTYFTLVLIC